MASLKKLMMSAAAIAAAFVAQPLELTAQVAPDRGAAALGSVLAGIGTTSRVLTVAAHPDDEDTPMIAWLAKGRHVETAYLSLTRGDGGQNLIGNELGEALGAIRTQELLAARRIDGATQYFTRAYDFGFSKNAEETYQHWPKDSILGDVVRVVRAYRPHVMIAFFSGTPRDGHGHHQVSGLLAREAYDLAGDTVRFPVKDFGVPWTPQKFYRSARQTPDSATLRVNTGEYDALLGRSYYEIAAESRSQHKSQGFGVLQRKGVIWGYLSREASRVGPADARSERSLFDGVDTTWAPLRAQLPASAQPVLDSALSTVRDARAAYRADAPAPMVPILAQALRQFRTVRGSWRSGPPLLIAGPPGSPSSVARRPADAAPAALWDALSTTEERTERALVLAAGVVVEATAPRATFPAREPVKQAVNDSLPVTVTVFNRGTTPVLLRNASVFGLGLRPGETGDLTVAPDSAATLNRWAVAFVSNSPWWRVYGRKQQDWFQAPIDARHEEQHQEERASIVQARLEIAGQSVAVNTPVVYRYADPIKGDMQVPVSAVPGITINLASVMEYIRAGVPVERYIPVRIQSSYPHETTVSVQLELPAGLKADSTERVRTLAADGSTILQFRVRGMVKEGQQQLVALALHDGAMSTSGAYLINYDHITPMRLYGASGMYLSAVNVKIPPRARVGYIAGVGDKGIEALEQLDIAVEKIEPSMVSATNLSRFTSIVVGPRAYEASEALVRNNPRLLEYARQGGTLVVQYGAQNMNALPGITPYPLQWAPRAARVTMETAPVTVLQPTHPLLTFPNRIGAVDWEGWAQERATYMPSTIDKRYTSLLRMNDPDEPANDGALLVAPVGKGRYVYVTLALFRQLPAGVPGAARLLANLVGGGVVLQ
ncbi:PIG-L family deacetylase [Gemmatimonas phototrophica]|uniref:PIG-L family deacetylase n=1 Tax=Gemmatimonas phototrophica TaxID=1379270 RepID=UPI001314A30A|nr:PIG-L family deacetylase [Gemmatimonas phototrophica]